MFINLSGNEKHTDSSVNKVVRSHVMRECKRQKRDKQRRKPSAATSIFRHDKFNLRFTNGRNFDKRNARNAEEYEKGLVVSGEVGAEMELGSYPTSQHNSTLNGQVQDYSTSTTTCETFLQFPFTQLNGMVDPFNVLPIPSSPRVMMLLHHSKSSNACSNSHEYLQNVPRSILTHFSRQRSNHTHLSSRRPNRSFRWLPCRRCCLALHDNVLRSRASPAPKRHRRS